MYNLGIGRYFKLGDKIALYKRKIKINFATRKPSFFIYQKTVKLYIPNKGFVAIT
jgi:hypothetical protein